jgi:hypothetical protein
MKSYPAFLIDLYVALDGGSLPAPGSTRRQSPWLGAARTPIWFRQHLTAWRPSPNASPTGATACRARCGTVQGARGGKGGQNSILYRRQGGSRLSLGGREQLGDSGSGAQGAAGLGVVPGGRRVLTAGGLRAAPVGLPCSPRGPRPGQGAGGVMANSAWPRAMAITPPSHRVPILLGHARALARPLLGNCDSQPFFVWNPSGIAIYELCTTLPPRCTTGARAHGAFRQPPWRRRRPYRRGRQ